MLIRQRLVNSLDEELETFERTSSLVKKMKPLESGFGKLAETEGFEPSMELLTPYSLSRGAPSASRASLRGTT